MADNTSLQVPNVLEADVPIASNQTVQLEASASTSVVKTEVTDNVSEVPQATVSKTPRSKKPSAPGAGQDGDDSAWGSNFWVTLVDPQSQSSFFACPATGQVSWDPPVGNFVLPPSEEGEWWELADDSRGGLPYYYQTKTGETVWERPAGFNTALGRRLSQTTRFSITGSYPTNTRDKSASRRSRQHASEPDQFSGSQIRQAQSSRSPSTTTIVRPTIQRSYSNEPRIHITHVGPSRSQFPGQQLAPIPGSDASAPSSPSQKSFSLAPINSVDHSPSEEADEQGKKSRLNGNAYNAESISRARAKSSSYISHRPQQPQSLNAALEKISTSRSDSGHGSSPKSPTSFSSKTTRSSGQYDHGRRPLVEPSTPIKGKAGRNAPLSPRRPIPAAPTSGARSVSGPTVGGKGISGPIPNHCQSSSRHRSSEADICPAATLQMSPVKNRANGQPIPIQPRMPPLPKHASSLDSGRKVPVTQLMTWQKAPLSSPLLTINRSLAKDAVKVFKVIQHLMGDRERERAPRLQPENHMSAMNLTNASTASLTGNTFGMLEEERWLLGEGLSHGELRDEIYCQLMKQLTGNSSTESVFKGWQLLCVLLITFPPSKNFENYLSSFFQQHITQREGRVDVMAKYCLRRLEYISKKGPRGKPPTLAEIETASDAAFHPSTFGESLDAIIRLQERKYPQQKVPIILPFLADGILALGGLKAEGIFRVPGDADSVSELKLRIDRGYYTTDGVNDPHVLASLMKLWLRELCDPLVPEEMYNECITSSKDADACVRIIERLPTINRRVVLFVISFLQLFLEEKVQSITKMTPANLALVMAPNLLRCNSDSMSVVFTNAQFEQIFVYNLLLHLQCGDIDSDYIPTHGLGAASSMARPKSSKSRFRRPH
ncbi:hypothetical protein D9615_002353 [Tricholomella constricta]|uniref:Rho GTPase-activating protein 39 n=1 Tax=Tricholomella constricta TaxID=117010 RepID=A0A8H5HM15_9AGAR|nr:hypothetical protein D9615_002353 [Tricholomella constricta]